MPNAQPDIDTMPPGASQGPFSRYLNAPLEGKAIEDTTPEPRPSGFMGTTGKLAMFGGALLKGLQQGSMQAYAQREQDKINQYEQLARRVQAFQSNPDLPPEVKAEAANLLTQAWGTQTKEQVQAAKKFHGKQGSGPGSHVLGFFEHIADKLSGGTPTEHNLSGGKDASGRPAMDRLNDLLADAHTGGEKYSIKGRWEAGINRLNEVAKKYPDSPFDQLTNTPEFRTEMDRLRDLNPQRAQMMERDLAQARPRLGLRDTIERETIEDLAKQKRNPPAVSAGPSPQIDQTQNGPMLDKSAGEAKPGEAKAFKPYAIGGLLGGVQITSPEMERKYLDVVIPSVTSHSNKVYFKRTIPGPDGKPVTQRIEGREYPQVGVVVDSLTGNRIAADQGWAPTTPGDKDPAPPKPALTTIKRQGPGDTMIEERVELKPGEPLSYQPYRPPQKVRAGSGIPNEYRELQIENLRHMMEDRMDTHDDKTRKRNAGLLVNKIMEDIYSDSKKYNMTPEELLKQRLDDFPVHYKDDPRYKDTYEAVREGLVKKQGEVVAITKNKIKLEEERKKAEKLGAIPKPDPKKSGPAIETKKKGKLTDEKKTEEYLDKAGGDVKKARELAAKDGWEF